MRAWRAWVTAVVAAAVSCAAEEKTDVDDVGENMCTGRVFNASGFTGVSWEGLWWARHSNESRWINGKPTYHAGTSMPRAEWRDTGRYYMYWCPRGAGSWMIGGPSGAADSDEYVERDENFRGVACHELASKIDASEIIIEELSTWRLAARVFGSQVNLDRTVTMNSCGVQVDACDDSDCPGFPSGIPFDRCVPMRTCGARGSSRKYLRAASTEAQQKADAWTNITIEVYTDQYCTHAPAAQDVACDECGAQGVLPGAAVTCASLRALQPRDAGSSFITYIVVCIVIFSVLNVVISIYKHQVYLKKRKERDERRREQDQELPLLEREPPLIADLEEKLRIFYLRAARDKAGSARVLAERAVRQAPNPQQFVRNLLLQRYPDEAAFVEELFGDPELQPPPANHPPPASGITHLSDTASTLDYMREAEDAIRQAEHNRHEREGINGHAATPPPPARGHDVPILQSPPTGNPMWKKKRGKSEARGSAHDASDPDGTPPPPSLENGGSREADGLGNGNGYTPPPNAATPPPPPLASSAVLDMHVASSSGTPATFSGDADTGGRRPMKKKRKAANSTATPPPASLTPPPMPGVTPPSRLRTESDVLGGVDVDVDVNVVDDEL